MASKQTMQDNNGNDIHPITLANAVFNKKLKLLSGQISEYERNISDFLQRMSKSNQELRALKLKAAQLLSLSAGEGGGNNPDIQVDGNVIMVDGVLTGNLMDSFNINESKTSYSNYIPGEGLILKTDGASSLYPVISGTNTMKDMDYQTITVEYYYKSSVAPSDKRVEFAVGEHYDSHDGNGTNALGSWQMIYLYGTNGISTYGQRTFDISELELTGNHLSFYIHTYDEIDMEVVITDIIINKENAVSTYLDNQIMVDGVLTGNIVNGFNISESKKSYTNYEGKGLEMKLKGTSSTYPAVTSINKLPANTYLSITVKYNYSSPGTSDEHVYFAIGNHYDLMNGSTSQAIGNYQSIYLYGTNGETVSGEHTFDITGSNLNSGNYYLATYLKTSDKIDMNLTITDISVAVPVTVDPCILLSGGYLNTDSPAGELKMTHTSVTNSTGSYALYTAGTGVRLYINPNNTDAVAIATCTTGTIDFSQYTKIDVTAYSTAGNGGKNLSVGLAGNNNISFCYDNIGFDNSSSVTLTSSATTYTMDISSWTGTGYLVVWSFNNNYDYVNTWISEITIY